MQINCNAGFLHTNLIGDLPGNGIIWYRKNSIANILSFANVINKNKVIYDSSKGNQFMVHKPDGSTHIFAVGSIC